MAIVKAVFDGQVFVPSEAVQLPVGTKVEVLLPDPARPSTAAEEREWEEIRRELNASEPPFASVDEAMRYLRKRP